jgi:twinkle protein
MITNADEIKQRADIVEIIGSYIQLKKDGSGWKALCPFHKEKTPSFKVSNKGYKCFGCGKSGDVISFLMDHESLNYIQAIKLLAEKTNTQVEEETKSYEKPVPRLEKLPAQTIQYFESRGISNNTLLKFGITQSTEWMPGAGKEVPAICFNYIRDGELVNIKFRAKDKDFKLSKNAELIFYNIDAIENEQQAIIVEGEIDCLSMYEAGIYNVVSVPNGAASGQLQLKYLDNCWEKFEGKDIILFTDNDKPGEALKEELARRLGKARSFKVTYPQDCKDANDVLVKHGKGMLQSMIESAQRWPLEGITTMDDVYPLVCDYYENGYPPGVAANIGEFDSLLTFTGGQLTVVTGSPGSGKSEFIDYITTSLARVHGWKFGVCSFENPVAFHVTKLMEKFIGLSFQFRKNPEHRMSRGEFEHGVALTDRHFYFVNTSQADITIQGILDKLTEVVKRYGIKGVVLDPWNYIEHKVPHGYTETQYISEALSLIKEFAVRTDTHVFLVAHPKKLMKNPQTKEYPVATMYDISGSAHFFNKTDNGISIHRDFNTGVVTVYVQKVRFSWMGKIGFCCYSFDTFIRQYIQI